MPTTNSSDKPKTKIDRIKVLTYWTPWPHDFNRLMMKYQISHSFLVTLIYLWQATVGSGDDTCGYLALRQIPVRRKHAEKWLAALCESGLFTVEKAKLGSQDGSRYEYREDATMKDWETLFHRLAEIEKLGGLEDKFRVEKFGKMVANTFKQAEDDYVQADDVAKRNFLQRRGKKVSHVPSGKVKNVQIDGAAATKRVAAALEALEDATCRKRS